MREFNIFGPVNPKYHYHVNRVAVKAAMREKIEKGRYFTLNAARQTGKTTLFLETLSEMEAGGDYFGIVLNVENLGGYEPARLYERLGVQLNEAVAARLGILAEEPARQVEDFIRNAPMRDRGDFGDYLRAISRLSGRRVVLILDEFGALPREQLGLLLHEFRYQYMRRWEVGAFSPQSVILVGVESVPALMEGTQSPFNIADQFTVPYFTPEETADLLSQHTAETGQPFAPEVIEGVMRETEGQPFLVNRLGQLLTQDIAPEREQAITGTDLDYALALLLTENNTHFSSIISKAAPHRANLLPTLFYNERRADFLDPVTQELLMYGILRVVEGENRLRVAQMSNPIYRKMLIMRFAPPRGDLPFNGGMINRYVVNGTLDFDGLMESYKAFMEEHGVRLLRSEATGQPLEISGQYLLLSYLTAALNSVGGHVTVESLSSAGEMDVLAFFRSHRFIVETKIWRGPATFQEGKQQLVKYLKASRLAKGYLVIFDERVEANPLAAESGPVFETTADDKALRVYVVGIK